MVKTQYLGTLAIASVLAFGAVACGGASTPDAQEQVDPCAADPCAATPCAGAPCAGAPCAGAPCAADPCAAQPCAGS